VADSLSLCMIVRDCGHSIRPCLLSVLDRPAGPLADEVVVVDTGSRDDTVSQVERLAAEFPAVAFTISLAGPDYRPAWYAAGGICSACDALRDDCERCGGSGVHADDGSPVLINFAAARQHSFELATGDWRMWLDADDRIPLPEEVRGILGLCPAQDDGPPPDKLTVRGLRDILTEQRLRGSNVVVAPYHYLVDDQRRPLIRILNQRIVYWKALPWRWHGRIHESLHVPADAGRSVMLPEFIVEQSLPNHSNRLGRNLVVLRHILAHDGPPDARTLIYFADHFARDGYTERAIEICREATVFASTVTDRYMATNGLGNVLLEAGRPDEARREYLVATSIDPTPPNAYFGLFRAHRAMFDRQRALDWYERGAERPTPDNYAFLSPMDRLVLHREALDVAMEADRLDAAERIYRRILEFDGEERDFDLEIRFESGRSRRRAERTYYDLARLLLSHEEPLKAAALLDAAPGFCEDSQLLQHMRVEVGRQLAHLRRPDGYDKFYRLFDAHQGTGGQIVSDNVILSDVIGAVRQQWIEETLRRLDARTTLEIGCACGWMSARIAHHLGDQIEYAHGVDMSEQFIEAARRRAVRLGLGDRLGYTQSAFPNADLKLPRELFDAVIVADILEHLPEDEMVGFLREAAKLGRRLLISVPHGAFEPGYRFTPRGQIAGHVRAFSRRKMMDLLRAAGLAVESYRDDVREYPGTPEISTRYMLVEATEIEVPRCGRMIVYVPGSLEDWLPGDENGKGLGGSETAVIRVTEGLAARGWDVTVFGSTIEQSRRGRRDRSGYYCGVEYAPSGEYDPRMECDLFVSFRTVLDPEWYPDCNCQKVAWLQDMNVGDRMTQERVDPLDEIWTLSPAHDRHLLGEAYPDIRFPRLVNIPNGLDPDRFEREEGNERCAEKIIWLSSWDRNLLDALKILRLVQIPFEFHIFYGTYAMDRAIAIYPEKWQRYEKLKQEIREAAAGMNVIFHERTAQDVLAQQILSSNIWLYPLSARVESGCIASLEAMAGGAFPICSGMDALGDWCRKYGSVHEADCPEQCYADDIEELIQLFGVPEIEDRRNRMMQWARKVFDWQQTVERVDGERKTLMALDSNYDV